MTCVSVAMTEHSTQHLLGTKVRYPCLQCCNVHALILEQDSAICYPEWELGTDTVALFYDTPVGGLLP
jgi:hypothetical protein